MLDGEHGDVGAEFVARLQQLTGPVAAKGVEDTALYCFNRLTSLNDVGGDPGQFGTSVAEFHRLCQARQQRRPLTMLATSTHDTKRSEDVRARISLLSEMPEQWEAAVSRWSAWNEPRRRGGAPSRNDEYLFYQTLVGAWPISQDRLTAYMEKAVREAKLRTSWLDPDGAYEEALRQFVGGALADRRFTSDLEAFLGPLQAPARINSLSQTLIKCTAPGVPDFYQGSELADLSLVDPDNRRPVDYERCRGLLAQLAGIHVQQACSSPEAALSKLLVIQAAAVLRRRRPELFGPGSVPPSVGTGRQDRPRGGIRPGRRGHYGGARLWIRAGGDWAGPPCPCPAANG